MRLEEIQKKDGWLTFREMVIPDTVAWLGGYPRFTRLVFGLLLFEAAMSPVFRTSN